MHICVIRFFVLIEAGMTTVVGNGLIKMQLMNEAEFDELQLSVLEEAKNDGIEFEWYATWAKKR